VQAAQQRPAVGVEAVSISRSSYRRGPRLARPRRPRWRRCTVSLRHRPAGHGRRCGPGPQRSPSPLAPCCACTAGFPWPRSTGRA